MNSKILITEIWVEIFQHIASLKFYSLHNLLLVNRSFCSCVVPLLWADPLEKARSDDDRYKIIDIYLSCLNKEEQIELDKLLKENLQIYEKYKKKKPPLFSYVDFLRRYNFYETKQVGVFMWCLQNDILSLKPKVFLIIHKMIVRVCRHIKELNISENTFDAECFVNLPRPWFPQSTITSLDISFRLFPYTLNESISQLIRKAFQELKEIRVIKASFGNGITEDKENLSKAFIILPTGHKNLYKLSLYAIIFTENDLRNIASLPNLKFLKIENSSFEAKDKEIISIEKNQSISQFIRKVFQLKQIRVIKASFGKGITDDSKEAMQELIDTQSELEEFQLKYSPMPKEENLSKAFIILPTGHKNLYKLSLDAIIFTENDLRNIASLPNLKFLKIENSSFEAKDKEIISVSTCSLTKLQELKLNNNELKIIKLLVCMKCETLKTLSITLTNSQIEKNDVSNEFCSLINHTSEERQEVNPEANNWNREFAKGERAASRVNKILVESTIYHKVSIQFINDQRCA
ncbi:11626_t:CDS:2 [Cetraspora pellucida]|uniref:11626_t:CDS:1 n=1 Tax=Cetraspora pellucida TaxID=1433469 RepID=A0ACA9L2A2_9GLOM|nr:11626_t:CDS:2 [Cetraspora pellucida]